MKENPLPCCIPIVRSQCCLDPKSPATPSLMNHHGNRGAAPQISRGKGSEVCETEVQTLEAAEQGLGCLWSLGRGMVPRDCSRQVGTILQKEWAAVNYSC